MRRNRLGRSDLEVSELCLGTMTWGSQTPPADAHAQIDMALERGVNILDTAEMYPVNPISAETAGRSEEIIGDWIARGGRREALMIATKITGKGNKSVRGGVPISPATIAEAVEGSLRRLKTDYIDLYQLALAEPGLLHVPAELAFRALETEHRRDAPSHG